MAELHSVRTVKTYTSIKGIGLPVNAKSMTYSAGNVGYGLEVWGEVEEPWHVGKTVIADSGYYWLTRWEAGKPYVITCYFRANDSLVGIYADICRPVRRIEGGFEFDDLYVDVFTEGTSRVCQVLDQDELEEAVKLGYITSSEAEMAKVVARQVVEMLSGSQNLAITEEIEKMLAGYTKVQPPTG